MYARSPRLIAVVVATVAAVLVVLAAAAEAKLCRESPSSSVWKHEKGSFKRVGPKQWKEFNDKNVPNAETFTEVLREGSSIVIGDAKRGVEILLKEDIAGIKQRGDGQAAGNFQQLYKGSFLRVVDCT